MGKRVRRVLSGGDCGRRSETQRLFERRLFSTKESRMKTKGELCHVDLIGVFSRSTPPQRHRCRCQSGISGLIKFDSSIFDSCIRDSSTFGFALISEREREQAGSRHISSSRIQHSWPSSRPSTERMRCTTCRVYMQPFLSSAGGGASNARHAHGCTVLTSTSQQGNMRHVEVEPSLLYMYVHV